MGVNRVPGGLCSAGLCAAIALAASPLGAWQAAPGSQQAAQGHAAAQAAAPGERPFKNIQVLKDFSHTQALEGMEYITVALGQRCEFCHNTYGFPQRRQAGICHPPPVMLVGAGNRGRHTSRGGSFLNRTLS